MEKPGQGADSTTPLAPASALPPASALAPKQFPQPTANSKWRPKEIDYFNGNNVELTAFVFRFKSIAVVKKAKNHSIKSRH